nr:H356 [uncultured bacterium]
MATKYLLAYPQPSGRGRRFIEALDLDAFYPDQTRDTGRRIAGMPMRESTGKPNRRQLRLMVLVQSRTGGIMGMGNSLVVNNTSIGVRNAVRSIRPQELDQLEAVDRQLAELRAQRQELLRLAWQRGHHLPLGELRAKADRRARGKDAH